MNYIGWDGLVDWVFRAKEHEKIGVGIRPYGLHVGNLTALVAYPYLLCERYKESKQKEPAFSFQVWLNDIEPVSYVGEDGLRESADAANMYPGDTTFQFASAPDGFQGSLADYWQPAIEGVVRGTIGTQFPKVKIEFPRASKLVFTPQFEKMVRACIKTPDTIARIIEAKTGERIRGQKTFVWPVHPDHHAYIEQTKIEKKKLFGIFPLGKEKIIHFSQGTDHEQKSMVKNLSWAVQFRMLQAVRLAAEQPDLWIMGLDHLPTNRSGMMRGLADAFEIDQHKGNFLHTPLLFTADGKKVSKSLGNAKFIDLTQLIHILKENKNKGVDVEYAPVSEDIIALGASFLPEHMLQDREQRQTAHEKETDLYNESGKHERFVSANADGKIRERDVARIIGVPHL